MTRAPDVYLSNCPHCGAEVEIDHIEPHTHKIATWMPDHPGSYYIECQCGAGMIDEDCEGLIKRWNRRVA